MASNFELLAQYWPAMAQIGKMAELYLYADSNACIYKIGVLAERIAQEI
jgi:type I restriction enzyme R subunit